MDIKERISALRKEMKNNGISAYIIVSGDAHLSEYTPERWQSRSWISGFNGSAGSIVVTLDRAGLWTDSRYFLQAAEQLEGSSIELFKQGIAGVDSIESFLCKELKSGDVVAVDGDTISHEELERIRINLSVYGIKMALDIDLIDKIWENRPSIPNKKVFLHKEEYSGESAASRIERTKKELTKYGANTSIITMIDEVAWLMNLRGYDVDYNPVAVSYAIVSPKETVLFILKEKLNEEVTTYLNKNGIKVKDYFEIKDYIKSLDKSSKVLVDAKRITENLYRSIADDITKVNGVSVITSLKAEKNEVEASRLREVMRRDGVALTKFFKFLEESLADGKTFTEYEIDEILRSFRAKDPNYYGDSFATICGYNAHGAIVHYRASKESSFTIENKGVLLLDSGGQYYDGTTDITRTIALDEPSDKLKKDYTLVLKGHIGIATAIYLEGTRGSQLDILARKALWDNLMNYGHGTGHGVGYFLNVHEGPQNIRMEVNPTELKIGMITSNEPGLYRTDEYGIRIENLVLTKDFQTTEFGRFFNFETLTLCYLDNNLVEKTLLDEKEITWYNEYQERVYRELSPLLNEEEAIWLRNKTKSI